MKKKLKDLDNFRHRKLILKVRKLQTAEDQKYFEVVRIKKIFPLSLLIYIYICILIALGDHRDPPQPWTL